MISLIALLCSSLLLPLAISAPNEETLPDSAVLEIQAYGLTETDDSHMLSQDPEKEIRIFLIPAGVTFEAAPDAEALRQAAVSHTSTSPEGRALLLAKSGSYKICAAAKPYGKDAAADIIACEDIELLPIVKTSLQLIHTMRGDKLYFGNLK
ncbi:MAG: hypothetical protein Q8Q08_06580 [Candidatus Omnitrophota bacterium]|nr:hypothetical protein [Candidatus Omnitrophota bacterium]MDZ4243277.1 hypothetical protein [Candidatus Omnitrophota bacterium]